MSSITSKSATSVFKYRAREQATGRVRVGEQTANSAFDVRITLRRLGLEPESVTQVGANKQARTAGGLRRLLLAFRRRRNNTAKADFLDSLATLLKAGVALEVSLSSLADSLLRRKNERRMIKSICTMVREGLPFSDACEQQEEWFDTFDIALLRAGERAGELESTLWELSDLHRKRGAFSQELTTALIYPVVVFIVIIGVIEFLSFNTMPQLVNLIVQGGGQVPQLTTTIITIGQSIPFIWPITLAFFFFLVVIIPKIDRRFPNAAVLQFARRCVPWRSVLTKARAARLASGLARLLRAGLPLTEALETIVQTTADRAMRTMLGRVNTVIAQGGDFSVALRNERLLDPEFNRLVQLGEESGELIDMLWRLAERYQRAVERESAKLMAMVGPIAILLLACLVGVVVMASILPLMAMGG